MTPASPLISSATQRNWAKLNTADSERLKSRANKSRSQKKIVPDAYIASSGLEPLIREVGHCDADLKDIMYSLCRVKLSKVRKDNPNIGRFFKEYGICRPLEFHIPTDVMNNDRHDWLGYIYQSQLPEGERNVNGQYYTGKDIVLKMLSGIELKSDRRLLDPCCGGGAFLLCAEAKSLAQLYGVDSDETAVMICKANLIAKYPEDFTYPQIYHADYLEKPSIGQTSPLDGLKFDYIYTNPPWGVSRLHKYESEVVKSGERASLFLEKSVRLLRDNGSLNFLMPSSILKIRAHSDIRGYLLSHTSIREICLYQERFNGVFTDFFSIKVQKAQPVEGQRYDVWKDGEKTVVAIKDISNQTGITLNGSFDDNIIKKIEERRNDDLSHSVWALGIVTGDNKNKLKKDAFADGEAIYTGKDIVPFAIREPSNFILFDRAQLQQCAREELYRCPEKLVYKFISKSLCFAYDNRKSLFLNSANILIPDVDGLSIKTVMAFLNSELFSFYYYKRFADIKILKGNLECLPFPKISGEQDRNITKLVDSIPENRELAIKEINRVIFSIYGFEEKEIDHIKTFIHGNSAR